MSAQEIKPVRLFGSELQPGDVVDLWFGRCTIIKLRPYVGPLEHLWAADGGAAIASFAERKTEMTIEPGALFNVLNRPAAQS